MDLTYLTSFKMISVGRQIYMRRVSSRKKQDATGNLLLTGTVLLNFQFDELAFSTCSVKTTYL